jgi:beta-lactam-binding protein with PASTA domain/predicted Ser/Thr protein kinase
VRLAEGTLVDGRYRFVRRLGSGGMADVWLADDTELSRKVALKVLHERFAQDSQFVERFRREAAAAAGLQHPNVVGVFDRGEFDGSYYIAMEYVEGSSLKELIDRGLSVPQAVEIARQILAAVRFAHEHGIVHRDIKPHNVIVDPAGRVRVLDFGIARAGASEITQTGSVMGTAQYLSPEQAQGLEVTPASDIYSVGVVLYEMLTGRVPFEGDSAVAVALKQVSEQAMPPSALNPAVPPALDRVVLRALAKDPGNRFASAEEFSRALDAAEADPTGAGLSDTAMFGAVAVPDQAEAAAAAEEERRRRRRRWAVAGVVAALLAAVAVFALTRPDRVNVPSVLDRDVDRAEVILEDAGFEVAVEEVANEAPRDTVLEQDPRAGEEADEGSTVTLTVSTGPGQGEVPDVVGLPVREATLDLRDAGFEVEEEREASDSVDAGLVISTDPRPGEEAKMGSTVTIVVSSGRELVTVPDVLNQSESSARGELARAGFVVNVETEESDFEEGTVIEQDPGAGSRIEEGSQVTIVVSRGPGDVSVPNVVGQRQESAEARLAGLGFDVRVTTRDTESQSEDGRVLDQSPSAGTSLPPNSDVTIVVGRFVEPDEPAEPSEPEAPPPGDEPVVVP